MEACCRGISQAYIEGEQGILMIIVRKKPEMQLCLLCLFSRVIITQHSYSAKVI